MAQTLQWFLDREQTFILRNTTEIFIKDEEMAKKLFSLQDVGQEYTFSEKLRVHRARPEECLSCSAWYTIL